MIMSLGGIKEIINNEITWVWTDSVNVIIVAAPVRVGAGFISERAPVIAYLVPEGV